MGYRRLPENARLSRGTPEYAAFAAAMPGVYRMFRRVGYGAAERNAVVIEVRTAIAAGRPWRSCPAYGKLRREYDGKLAESRTEKADATARSRTFRVRSEDGKTRYVSVGELVGDAADFRKEAKRLERRYYYVKRVSNSLPDERRLRSPTRRTYELVDGSGNKVRLSLRELTAAYMAKNGVAPSGRHRASAMIHARVAASKWKKLSDVVAPVGCGPADFERRGRPRLAKPEVTAREKYKSARRKLRAGQRREMAAFRKKARAEYAAMKSRHRSDLAAFRKSGKDAYAALRARHAEELAALAAAEKARRGGEPA